MDPGEVGADDHGGDAEVVHPAREDAEVAGVAVESVEQCWEEEAGEGADEEGEQDQLLRGYQGSC